MKVDSVCGESFFLQTLYLSSDSIPQAIRFSVSCSQSQNKFLPFAIAVCLVQIVCCSVFSFLGDILALHMYSVQNTIFYQATVNLSRALRYVLSALLVLLPSNGIANSSKEERLLIGLPMPQHIQIALRFSVKSVPNSREYQDFLEWLHV